MKLVILMLIFLTACAGCKKILSYMPDTDFLSSAQANSPEILTRINGKICRDMEGKIGLCAKRVKSDEALTFTLDKRPYSYRLSVTCSSLVNFSLNIDVLKDKAMTFKIDPEDFSEIKSFTCVGEVFPHDREESISAFFHVRVIVVDSNYMGRESIYEEGEHLVLGKSSLHSTANGSKHFNQKTFIKKKGIETLTTESHLMRFSYWGY